MKNAERKKGKEGGNKEQETEERGKRAGLGDVEVRQENTYRIAVVVLHWHAT